MPTDVLLDWNPIAVTGVTYDAQIADDGRDFRRLVYERFNISDAYARKQCGLAPEGDYWWRVRSSISGRESPWSSPVQFRTSAAVRSDADNKQQFFIKADCTVTGSKNFKVHGTSNLPEGSRIDLRVYDEAGGSYPQSTLTRVRTGMISRVIPEPKNGWPADRPLLLFFDCVAGDQLYPVSTELGRRGRVFKERGIAADHEYLYGFVLEIEVVPGETNHHAAVIIPAAGDGNEWRLDLKARFISECKLRISATTSLPENTRITVIVEKSNRVDNVFKETVLVHNGAFSTDADLEADTNYTITALFRPDTQYLSIRKTLGARGELLHKQQIPTHHATFGVRYQLPLPHRCPQEGYRQDL